MWVKKRKPCEAFVFFSPFNERERKKKNSFEFSANFMFVDRLTFLYPGSNLTINGRKTQGSGVILRICLSCAVEWEEGRAAKQG